MEQIIKKWESILEMDKTGTITYSTAVLIEMLNDFKQAGINTNVGGPSVAGADGGKLLQGEASEKGVSVDSCYCNEMCGYKGVCVCSNGMSEADRA